MSGRSTVTNLLTFTHKIIGAFENNNQLDAIYTDVSKAFDKVSHSLLVAKLNAFGVHGSLLSWITNYLIEKKTICEN